MKPPRLCSCGQVVPAGFRCECQIKQDRDRKRRFDLKRPSARERGYTSEWEKERAAYLSAYPTCKRCGDTATTVDHVIPHKGNARLFWDRTNWQPLCTPCHNSAKQSEERAQ